MRPLGPSDSTGLHRSPVWMEQQDNEGLMVEDVKDRWTKLPLYPLASLLVSLCAARRDDRHPPTCRYRPSVSPLARDIKNRVHHFKFIDPYADGISYLCSDFQGNHNKPGGSAGLADGSKCVQAAKWAGQTGHLGGLNDVQFDLESE
ncbi:hypothetical protein M8C21_010398, partial [Ambrosia artemisiifolia]